MLAKGQADRRASVMAMDLSQLCLLAEIREQGICASHGAAPKAVSKPPNSSRCISNCIGRVGFFCAAQPAYYILNGRPTVQIGHGRPFLPHCSLPRPILLDSQACLLHNAGTAIRKETPRGRTNLSLRPSTMVQASRHRSLRRCHDSIR